MDKDQGKRSGRKVKYPPKAPPSRKPNLNAHNPESKIEEEEEEAQVQRLVRQLNEANARRRPKEKTSTSSSEFHPAASAQVAFGARDSASPSIKTFGPQREVTSTKGTDTDRKDSASDERPIVSVSPPTPREVGITPSTSGASARKIKENYKEPWDYENSYYPTTLPLREPFSGDPELLDEAEFGEAARSLEYDESTINSASELEFLEECEKTKMLFFQLPYKLPLDKQSASRNGEEKVKSSEASGSANAQKDMDLKELPAGYMGKMLVYKSGAVKLKLGNNLFNVSPGLNCSFDQNVVVINTEDKTCCNLGELDKRAIVTPDIDSMLKQ